MEKILLHDNSFDLKNSGIKVYNDRLSVNLINVSNTLDEIETMFSDPGKITLVSEAGETLRIFDDYNKLVEIRKNKDVALSYEIVDDEEVVTRGDVVTVVLAKENG